MIPTGLRTGMYSKYGSRCRADRAHRRKPQQKKHKTWDGDGFLMYRGQKLTLLSDSGLVYVCKPFS